MFIRKMSKTVDNYATVFEYWFLKKPSKDEKIDRSNIKSGKKIATSIYLTATNTSQSADSALETGRLKKACKAYRDIRNDNKFKKMTQKVVEAVNNKSDENLREALKNLVNLKRIKRLFLTATTYSNVIQKVNIVTCKQVSDHSKYSNTKREIKNLDNDDSLLEQYILPYWFLKKTQKDIPKPIEQIIASIYRTGVKDAPKAVKDTSRLAKARIAYKKLKNTSITSVVESCVEAIYKREESELIDGYVQLLENSSISRFTSKLANELPKSSSININDILDELEIRKATEDNNKNVRAKARANKGDFAKIRKLDNEITNLLDQDITQIDNKKLIKCLTEINNLHESINDDYTNESSVSDARMNLFKPTKTKIRTKGIEIQEEFEKHILEKDKIENLKEKYDILSTIHDHSSALFSSYRLTNFKETLEKVKSALEEK